MDPLTHFIIWMVCFVIGVPTLIIILICAFSPNPKPEPIIEPIINPLFDETYKVVTILSTKDEIKPEKSNELVKALSYMATQLVLHVFSTPSAIEISIICKSEDVHRLRQTIFGATDSVDIEISPAPEYMPEVTGVTCELTRMGNLEVFPLTRIHDFKETDPLNNILECVTPLEEFQA